MTDSRKIQTEIVKAVDLCNQVQVYLYYAFALFVKALKMKSSLPPCPSKSHSTTGKISTAKLWDQQLPWRPDDTTFTERTLAMIIDDPGFLTSLTRQLYSGERSQMSRLKSDTTFLDAATAAMIAYGFFVEQTGFGPLRSMAELPFGNIANMISKPVHTALKSHYSKARFDTDGTDTSLSDISYFFLHNGSVSPHGQQNQRRADFPKATLTPGSVCLSESNIIDILWANKNTKALLQFSLRTKLVPLNFKTKQDFQYVHDEYRGIVTEVVFGHGDYKRTDFMRNRAIQPASQDVQQYSTVDRGHPGDQRARTRHWLKGTVVTDGLVLYRLAYDASITKALRQQQQSQTQEDDDFDDDDGLDLVDLADEQELDSLDAEDLEAVMKEAGLEMDHGLGSTDIDPGRNSASSGNPILSLHLIRYLIQHHFSTPPVQAYLQLRFQIRPGHGGRQGRDYCRI
ncbi:hypothetical protein BGZ47_003713 [Haplosporangium gracile]|nr:hypothetical protein BGZ47_003713 [Haplosporangium gracile]